MAAVAKQLIKEETEKRRLEEILREFEALKGSVKNIKRPTKEERDKWAREFLNSKDRSEILRKYGFDKV